MLSVSRSDTRASGIMYRSLEVLQDRSVLLYGNYRGMWLKATLHTQDECISLPQQTNGDSQGSREQEIDQETLQT